MSELAWREVVARRLARSHLLAPAPKARLVDVVRDVGLLQAQALPAAELGLALRVLNATLEDVRGALYADRTLVKTWSIRGALHLVPADELGLWCAAVGGHEARADPSVERIAAALDGRCLTRAELADAAGDGRIRSQWGEGLHAAAAAGVLVFGPPQGANVTFVRADEWLGRTVELDDAPAARREILRRYLRAYGPAKAEDFRRWSGFDREAVKRLFADADVEQVRVEGTRAYLLAGDVDGFDVDPRSVRLLPRYDAYVIGFRPREPLLPPQVKERIAADPKGRLESVTGMAPLIVDGVVHGFWKRDADVEHVLPFARGRRAELDSVVRRVRDLVG